MNDVRHGGGAFADLERRVEAQRARARARQFCVRVSRMLIMGATIANAGPYLDEIAELSELARLLVGEEART